MNKNAFAIYEVLLDKLIRNEFKEGDLLPGERELGKLFETTTMNGKKAVALLAARGVVKRVRHAGSFVEKFPFPHLLPALKNVQEKLSLLLLSRNTTGIHWDHETVEKFTSCMEEAGYKVIPIVFPAEIKRLQELLMFLPRLSPENVTILDDNFDHQFLFEFRELFEAFPCPIIRLNRFGATAPLNTPNTVSLNVDHYKNGYLAAKKALERPEKKIIVFGISKEKTLRKDSVHVYEKEEGLRRAFRERKMEDVLYLPDDPSSLRLLTERVKGEKNKVLIICLNNEFAAKVMDHLSTHFCRCPADYLLLSIESSHQYAKYDLSSIAMPKGELGIYLARIGSCKEISLAGLLPSFPVSGRFFKGKTF